jgi:hypothetical protein
LTDNATDDAAVVDELLDQTKNLPNKFGGDGAYDKWKVYDAGRKQFPFLIVTTIFLSANAYKKMDHYIIQGQGNRVLGLKP